MSFQNPGAEQLEHVNWQVLSITRLQLFSTRARESHLGGLKAACIGSAVSKFRPSVGDGATYSASCLLLQAARGGPAVYPDPQAPKSAAKGAGGCTVLYRTGRLGYWGTGILGDWGTGTGTSTRTKTGTGTGCFFLTEAPQNLLSTNPFTISGTSKPFNMGSCTWKI